MPTAPQQSRPPWRAFLSRPTVVAAGVTGIATVIVALMGAISGSISSYYQDQTAQTNLRYTAIFELIKHKQEEQPELARKFLQAGLIQDKDGKICAAFVGSGCPIH